MQRFPILLGQIVHGWLNGGWRPPVAILGQSRPFCITFYVEIGMWDTTTVHLSRKDQHNGWF